jgi:hypothetical protein
MVEVLVDVGVPQALFLESSMVPTLAGSAFLFDCEAEPEEDDTPNAFLGVDWRYPLPSSSSVLSSSSSSAD